MNEPQLLISVLAVIPQLRCNLPIQSHVTLTFIVIYDQFKFVSDLAQTYLRKVTR
jgi:hypothetical protein